jgi:protocatechuate 3,4-dioxygenase beta subunit
MNGRRTHRRNNRRAIERRFLLAALAGVPLAAATRARAQATAPSTRALRPTPSQTLGPFYPRNAGERPAQTDADLLVVEGDRVRTRGVALYLTGRVLTRAGQPVGNAQVEIWQCDANAVYHHPAGGAESQRDPDFQGYGRAVTDAAGAFHFRTIKPVPYPGRTAHIHVRVQAQGQSTLSTQLYLPDEPGNARDFLYRSLDADGRADLSLRLTPTGPGASHALARSTQFTTSVDLVLA